MHACVCACLYAYMCACIIECLFFFLHPTCFLGYFIVGIKVLGRMHAYFAYMLCVHACILCVHAYWSRMQSISLLSWVNLGAPLCCLLFATAAKMSNILDNGGCGVVRTIVEIAPQEEEYLNIVTRVRADNELEESIEGLRFLAKQLKSHVPANCLPDVILCMHAYVHACCACMHMHAFIICMHE